MFCGFYIPFSFFFFFKNKPDINVIELEDDDLNKHECMISLSWLVKHMKILGLIPPESSVSMILFLFFLNPV